jgi:hypothetical protein
MHRGPRKNPGTGRQTGQDPFIRNRQGGRVRSRRSRVPPSRVFDFAGQPVASPPLPAFAVKDNLEDIDENQTNSKVWPSSINDPSGCSIMHEEKP